MKQKWMKCGLRPSARVLLALGAAFLAARGAAAQSVRTGEMALELASAAQLSYLGVDTLELQTWVCGASILPSVKDPKLVVANDGGHTGRTFGLDATLATESSHGQVIAVEVLPGSLALIGPAPFVTGCGDWTYRVSLDQGAHPDASILTLVRSRASDLGGAFTGTVTLPAILAFTPVGGGATLERPHTLTLDLAGTWGLAGGSRGGASPGVPASSSNLVLFIQKAGSGWAKNAQVAATETEGDPNPGELVLQPTDEAMLWLNPALPR